jgi:hypothetical protein
MFSDGANEASIRRRIISYLEKSEFDEVLDAIVEDTEDSKLVADLLDDVVSPSHAAGLRGQVARYLESYPDHPNLLLLRGAVESLCLGADVDVVLNSIKSWAISSVASYSIPANKLVESYLVAMRFVADHSPDVINRVYVEILLKHGDRQFLRCLIERSTNNKEKEYAYGGLINLLTPKFTSVTEKLGDKVV